MRQWALLAAVLAILAGAAVRWGLPDDSDSDFDWGQVSALRYRPTTVAFGAYCPAGLPTMQVGGGGVVPCYTVLQLSGSTGCWDTPAPRPQVAPAPLQVPPWPVFTAVLSFDAYLPKLLSRVLPPPIRLAQLSSSFIQARRSAALSGWCGSTAAQRSATQIALGGAMQCSASCCISSQHTQTTQPAPLRPSAAINPCRPRRFTLLPSWVCQTPLQAGRCRWSSWRRPGASSPTRCAACCGCWPAWESSRKSDQVGEPACAA